MSETTYSISTLAALLEISPSTIRFYEEKGLILPSRSSGNQRIYTKRDKARLRLILRGKRFGFSLKEIAEMIGHADAEPTESEQIETTLAFARNQLADIEARRKELDLLEADIRAMQEKLEARLKALGS